MSAESFMMNAMGMSITILLLVLVFLIRLYMMRRAITQVIEIFRKRRSLCPTSAKTVDELGLAPPDLLTQLIRKKDYKPYALQILIRLDVVQVVEDGRVCMSEEKLHDVMPQAAR